jgi:hypothetical protein
MITSRIVGGFGAGKATDLLATIDGIDEIEPLATIVVTNARKHQAPGVRLVTTPVVPGEFTTT